MSTEIPCVSNHRQPDNLSRGRGFGSQFACMYGLLIGAVGILTGGLNATVSADEKADAAGIEYFEKHVRPLLVTHCYDCHAADEVNGGLVVDSRAGLLRGGDIGPAIVPGDLEKSLLIEVVRYSNRDLQMPPDGKLAKTDIEILEKWVEMGAPDPREEDPDSAAPKPTGMSVAEGKQFWSFQPLSHPDVPTNTDSDWVQTPIDQFVLKKLQQNSLTPAEPADKRTLIRRATYDLTGLPPSPEEIEAFLADETPEAFSKVVERLLASPQYGVRWGRHWLDVARYADSNGLDENLAYGNSWRYRDYVINSYNDDKPFNQFVVEQLAGDLVPGADAETRTATAFLALGAKVLAEPDVEKLKMDSIDEQLDSMGKAFMGMTIGCVRCHDHKFDPVLQTDYYALAAIFKSTKSFAETQTGVIKHWYEHELESNPADAERLKKIEKEIAAKKSAANSYKSAATKKLRDKTRGLATEYLIAAAQFEPTLSLVDVAAIAEPLGLHPRILHHCRLHLSYSQDDPFFAVWHELSQADDLVGIEQHYRPLLTRVDAAWAEAKKADPKATALADEQLEMARQALNDKAGFLAIPPKPEFAFDEETLAEYHRLMEVARVFESAAPDAATVMGVSEGETLETIPIHIRGSHLNLGEPVAREFPEVMRVADVRPILPANQSGRLQLAQWIASSQHPLTARVYVNRVWRWHFGQGIVNTPDNFGVLGDRPSHPELLDWLARNFIENGWSTKHLHRLIMSSAAYQMASRHADESSASEIDPENRLLWKFSLQRLEAEQIRDALLAVSGRLDLSLGGKTVPLRNRQFVFNHTSVDHTKYDSLRRAVYLPVIRNNIYTFFEQFDFPDPTMPTGDRQATVVAPQALLLMNSPMVIESAQQFAAHLLEQEITQADRIRLAYEKSFGRIPEQAEVKRVETFLNNWTADGGLSDERVAAEESEPNEQLQLQVWSMFCQSLFASNEFIYIR